MNSNEILTEIRRTRDDLARETGYDLQRLFDYIRRREHEAAARGVKFVAPTDDSRAESVSVLREQPPKS